MAVTGSAADRAYSLIRAAITSGQIPSGTMISENDMASRIAVSRTPVREAIVRLQDEGWLTILPKRGALVREITIKDAHDIADALHVLELASVRRASPATRRTLLAELGTVISSQEQRLADGSFEGSTDLDADFHRDLVVADSNPILVAFYDRLRERQALVISRGLISTTDRAREILAEHRRLFRSISDETCEECEQPPREHLTTTQEASLERPQPA